MRVVHVTGAGFGPVAASHASTFGERLKGLTAAASLPALLIDSSSVHTFGMQGPIGVVGLDEGMRVVASQVVAPNRVVWLRGSSRILEVPTEVSLPEVGIQLGLVSDA